MMHKNKRPPSTQSLQKAGASSILFVGIMLVGGTAVAQEGSQTPGIAFELGAGGIVAPSFEGSKSYAISPYPIIGFEYLRLQNGFSIGGGDGQGFSVVPSFRLRGERTARDNAALTGLDDVNTAVELGAGVSYTAGRFRLRGDLRRGVVGHQGITGEIGLDMITMPTEAITITLGPRMSFASSNYMSTYFGVSAAEAAGSAFPAYNAKGGIKSAGLEANLRYKFNENWALDTGASWNRLVGSAASTPIVAMTGSVNQFTFNLGLVRKFRIDF